MIVETSAFVQYFNASSIITLLVMSVMCSKTRHRYPSMIFAGVMMIHWLASGSLSGFTYTASATFADLVVIVLLSFLPTKSSLLIRLQKICLAFMVLNLYGFISWYTYQPVIIYNILCGLLYLYALIVISRAGYVSRRYRSNHFHSVSNRIDHQSVQNLRVHRAKKN